MYVLITYDVETTTSEGKTRLRKVEKVCENYGQRVQNSVFELSVYESDLTIIKKKIIDIIDDKKDSIRIYRLGNNWERKIETIGKNETYNPDSGLLLL